MMQTIKRMRRQSTFLATNWGQLRWRLSRPGLKQLRQQIEYWGWAVECPFCGWRGREFLPFGTVTRPNAACPRCWSLERHRLLFFYLRDRTPFFSEPCRVLEIGPSLYFKHLAARLPQMTYVSLDLQSPPASVCGDVKALPMPSQTFDVIVCYHVLVCVPDDRSALQEMRRVLKAGGRLFVNETLSGEVTQEAPEAMPPEERSLQFGDRTACRRYGHDFTQRLALTGYTVQLEPFASQLDPRVLRRQGLIPTDVIYDCTYRE